MAPNHVLVFLFCFPILLASLRRLLNRATAASDSITTAFLGRDFSNALKCSFALVSCFALVRCAYNIGTTERQIPGGYRLVSVPVFKNSTSEVGIEVYFTDAMIRELERSKLAKVVDKRGAEVVLIGTVESVKYLTTNAQIIGPSSPSPTPKVGANLIDNGGVQNTEYRILVTTDLKLQRVSDERILWQGKFSGERTYLTPIVSILGLNGVNSLYNQSAREQNIKLMSTDIMIEAYERMTENF